MTNNPKTNQQYECAVITVQNVSELLNISLSAAYDLVIHAYESGSTGDFKVIRCGRAYRIIKQSFFDFLGVSKGA